MKLRVLLSLMLMGAASVLPAMAAGKTVAKTVIETPRQETLPIEKVSIKDPGRSPLVLNVEMATTPEQQEIGLMGRTSMAPDAGMMFVFDEPGDVSFWMKDTLIPLDMLFIDPHGRIINIKENAEPMDRTPIPAGGLTKAVIEIGGGGAKAHGIKVGDTVDYKAFH